METQPQDFAETKSNNKLYQVTPISKYLAMVLFVILPFVGGWIGYKFGMENIDTKLEISNNLDQTDRAQVVTDDNQNLETGSEWNEQVAVEEYLAQKLSTVAVIDTLIPSVQIAVAGLREGSVYCGYDNGPCYFFLQAYNANYPRIKYLGSLNSVGSFRSSSIIPISPTVYEFDMSFGDAGVGILQKWQIDLEKETIVKVSETRSESEI